VVRTARTKKALGEPRTRPKCKYRADRPGQRTMPRSPSPEGAQHVSPGKATASTTRVLCHVWLVCITPGRGCAALGEGWQNQRKALKGRNKWRARQTPIRKPGQSLTRTETEQRCDRPSIAPPSRVASGNRRTGPWRLLRPFRAIGQVLIGNPGRRDCSQDSRSLALG